MIIFLFLSLSPFRLSSLVLKWKIVDVPVANILLSKWSSSYMFRNRATLRHCHISTPKLHRSAILLIFFCESQFVVDVQRDMNVATQRLTGTQELVHNFTILTLVLLYALVHWFKLIYKTIQWHINDEEKSVHAHCNWQENRHIITGYPRLFSKKNAGHSRTKIEINSRTFLGQTLFLHKILMYLRE